MFTGIVSAVAKVVEAKEGRLGIDHAAVARKLKVGSSVAVNGCCLTVVRKRGPVFLADVVPETLRRTNLGEHRAAGRREHDEHTRRARPLQKGREGWDNVAYAGRPSAAGRARPPTRAAGPGHAVPRRYRTRGRRVRRSSAWWLGPPRPAKR